MPSHQMQRSRKKICIIIPTHWATRMGGSQYQAKCIVDRLKAKGEYDIYFLAKGVNEKYIPDGYKLINISGRCGLHRYGFIFEAHKLTSILKHIRPNIIYQRVGCAYTGISAHYARKNYCKMVWHVAHDNDVQPMCYFSSPAYLIKYLDKKILEYGIRYADEVVTQTRHQNDLLFKNYKRSAAAIIPNFHPLPTNEIVKVKPVIILWAANFKQWKNPHAFIDLAKNLTGIVNARFVMIGEPSSDDVWQDELNNKIAGINSLEYLGKCSQEVVNEWMSRAHIFVNTSLYEGFANTFIQAWMRQVPVISLHVNPDSIFDSREIGLFSGKQTQLEKDIIMLVKDDSLRESMGKKAQEYAYENHSERNIDCLIKIFENKFR